MSFDYEYFWKPLLIFALIAYAIRVYYGFWSDAVKRRNEIFGAETQFRDGYIPPFPASEDQTHPGYRAYHDFFYPRFHRVAAKAAAAVLLLVLISFT
ncbi:MAG: hypothetical protein AAFN79_09820 [Pseudomonadota bacterium]